jgi:ribonuclease HII
LDTIQTSITSGDDISTSIAAASIIAKVTRDRIMDRLHAIYPEYNFAGHKGYGTEEHLKVLKKMGPSPIHRRSFEPVSELVLSRFPNYSETAENIDSQEKNVV